MVSSVNRIESKTSFVKPTKLVIKVDFNRNLINFWGGSIVDNFRPF